MTATSANAARQRAHWDTVLGADNIGERALTAKALRREADLARTPDFELLLRTVRSHENPAVLDLGGGLGVHALVLAQEGRRVIVADVSGERLRALSRVLAELDLRSRVLLVQTAAENLALRSGTMDVAWTKSVLIHTELETAVNEIVRCLAPDGEAVLCEPTDANPLVNLYRRLAAPRQWRTLTRYFTPESERCVLGALRGGHAERFYVLGFLAFFWQFGVRSVWLLRLTLAILMPVDRLMMRLWPAWRRRAWFVVMTGRGRSL